MANEMKQLVLDCGGAVLIMDDTAHGVVVRTFFHDSKTQIVFFDGADPGRDFTALKEFVDACAARRAANALR